MEPDNGTSQKTDQLTDTVVELAIRVGAVALLLYWSLALVAPFITIGIWSAVLAVALNPAYENLARLLGGRRVFAAVVFTIANVLIVIGPATWLALGVIEGVQSLAEKFGQSTLAIPPPPGSLRQWPFIGETVFNFWDLASTNIKAAFVQLAPHLKPLGLGLLGVAADAGTGVLKFLTAVILAGFLFSPAPTIAQAIVRFARRLAPTRGEEFTHLAALTIRAVTKGVIGISALQAFLAGLGFTAIGVPGASLLTTLVLILGIVQIGPSIIIIPMIIWSWTAYDTSTAILFTGYMIPVGLLDNILKPIVMARGLQTPMVIILLGVLGGTLSYGLMGLFLGPIVLAVIWELGAAWIAERDAETTIV